MVVFGQSGSICAWWLYFGKSGFIRANMVVFGQIWLYLGKYGWIWAKVVVFGQNLYSGKLVVFGEKCCIREKVLVFGQGGCVLEGWLSLGKSGFYRAKVVVFQIKVVVFGQIGFIR